MNDKSAGGRGLKFRLSNNSTTSYPDAEAVFRDLKNRDPKIQHLWSHQADIIRAYHADADHRDVALELPTGTGKTLVGLLVGDWRRREMGNRVAYLCPTRQLAHQVGAQAEEYGIPAHVLVGRQDEYPPSEYSAFAAAEGIAVTTYSGLFNTHPRIDNPETIVLDDAHAGESYIASMWSLSISRSTHRDLYDQVVELFEKELPPYLLPDLLDDDASPQQKGNVDLLPGPRFLQHAGPLTDLLNAAADKENQLIYPWQLLRGRLNGCVALFSWSEVLIRPPIPPTLTHHPFANAVQRIYMSATLGAGGELERITGIPNITRIPVPPGWDRQSTGRRLFVFPDRSFTQDEYEPWLVDQIRSSQRSLILTPHRFAADSFMALLATNSIEHEVLGSQHIETSLENFTAKPRALLLLTNRYDGLDLPGESCRSLVVFGLPASVNLYERFLLSKLGLSSVLADRIRTRITQAVGRCTRNSTDYAVVVMVGKDLLEYCIAHENWEELHPELRAEMEFGLENSEADSVDHLASLVELFLRRGRDWDPAESDITKRRTDNSRVTSPYVETLRSVVELEVMFQYDLWKEDYRTALEKATTIVDRLGGNDLAGYRALWNYFAGCAAYYQSTVASHDEFRRTASERFSRASQASRAVLWFARLSEELDPKSTQDLQPAVLTAIAVESISSYLTDLGTVGSTFEKALGNYRSWIGESDAAMFDQALTHLGKMLGFDADKPNGQAVPDSVWRLGTTYVLLFESKSDESVKGPISVQTCRQAQGHQAWNKAGHWFSQGGTVITIVISPRKFLSSDAAPHADGLFYLHIGEIRDMFSSSEACLRRIRSASAGLPTEQRFQLVMAQLAESGLTPNGVVARITKTRLLELPRQ